MLPQYVSFHAPKVPQVLEFLLYKTNRLPFSIICSVIDAQRTSECGIRTSVTKGGETGGGKIYGGGA